tara:strand:+ start:1144 stop:1392 length:249 start_codon:yes stop_codon:yes gene_type:complete
MLKADGFDKAFLGVASRFNMEDVFAYDMDECIAILCRRDNMSYEDAIEFFHYNVLGAWVGKKTPLFLKKYGSIKDAENALYL